MTVLPAVARRSPATSTPSRYFIAKIVVPFVISSPSPEPTAGAGNRYPRSFSNCRKSPCIPMFLLSPLATVQREDDDRPGTAARYCARPPSTVLACAVREHKGSGARPDTGPQQTFTVPSAAGSAPLVSGPPSACVSTDCPCPTPIPVAWGRCPHPG